MALTQIDIILMTMAATLGAILILALQSLQKRRQLVRDMQANTVARTGPVFLFAGDQLIDATADAAALIDPYLRTHTELGATVVALAPTFPDIGPALKAKAKDDTLLSCPDDSGLTLLIERAGQTTRLTVFCESARVTSAMLAEGSKEAELTLLRNVAAHTPSLIWQTDDAGALQWHNRAFAQQAIAHAGQDDDTPANLPELQDLSDALLVAPGQSRVALKTGAAQDKHWFDIFTVSKPDLALHFASNADAVMRADTARRDFVKTLGKTFAQLATGLAIFNKDRRLAMFNPALLDLTKLPVEFLSTRPTIDAVLDHLRELRMMPEPRDYASWRDQFAAVEDAAKAGTYSANWALPDGQMLRVIGKPHPDGAFAFLFEDITAEVSLNRRFRADIETGQAVLDALPDGIAVFSQAGTLMLSNTAYAQLWNTKPDILLDARDLHTEINTWQARCTPTAVWDAMSDMIARLGKRAPWSGDVMLDDGRLMRCHANPIPHGMTMIRFAVAPPQRPIMKTVNAPTERLKALKQ